MACEWQLDVIGRDEPNAVALLQVRAVTASTRCSGLGNPIAFDRYTLRVSAFNEAVEYRDVHTGKALDEGEDLDILHGDGAGITGYRQVVRLTAH